MSAAGIEQMVAEEGLKVVPTGQIPRGKSSEYRSAAHVHNRAIRYMEKCLLKHFWQAWRGSLNLSDLSFELGGEPEG